MKSIKEKANEYARDYLFNPFPQKAPNEHFVAGANYVLDAIADVINQPMNDYLLLGELKKLVLQLKK